MFLGEKVFGEKLFRRNKFLGRKNNFLWNVFFLWKRVFFVKDLLLWNKFIGEQKIFGDFYWWLLSHR